MVYQKKCIICGKEFEAKTKNTLLCSKECVKERVKRLSKEREARGKRNKEPCISVDEILKIANEHHLTYGKAVDAIEQGKIKIKEKM